MVAAGYAAAGRCLALDALAVGVVVALRDRGIESVLLKGPATVHRLYADEPASRRYTDVDLLVAPEQYAAAGAVLTELGLRNRHAGLRRSEAERRYKQSWASRSGLSLELHRSFFEVADGSAFWAVVWRDADRLVVAGTEVPIPGRVAAALLYGLHAAQHGRERRLSHKPLADLVRALTIFDEQTWRAAADLAAGLGAASAFAAGLSLHPTGADLARRLGLPTRTRPLVSVRMVGPSRRGDVQLASVLSTAGWTARLQYLRDVVFPSRARLAGSRPWVRRNRLLLGPAYVTWWARMIVALPGAVAHVVGSVRRPSNRSLWAAAARFARHPSRQRVRAAWWTVRALRAARAGLRATSPDQVRLPELPTALARDTDALRRHRGTVRWVLRFARASCLERCVVRQRWLAAAGRQLDLVVGVAGPAAEFRAHAWLSGERAEGFRELARYPCR